MSAEPNYLDEATMFLGQFDDPADYIAHFRKVLDRATERRDIASIVRLRKLSLAELERHQKLGWSERRLLPFQEAVRRGERQIHRAIRAARNHGEMLPPGTSPTRARPGDTRRSLESYGLERTPAGSSHPLLAGQIVDMSWATDKQFDAAIAEGYRTLRLSRYFLAQILNRNEATSRPLDSRSAHRLMMMRDMAKQGMNVEQIAERMGVQVTHIRRLALRNNITISGDDDKPKVGMINPVRVIEQTVYTIEGLVGGLKILEPDDYDELPPELVTHAAASLTDSITTLRKLTRELKNRVQHN